MASARLTFDCVDPPLLGHFWAAATGYRLVVYDAELIRLQGEQLGVDQLVFRAVERWKAAPNRLQLDLLTDDVEAESARLVALGATRVGDVAGTTVRPRTTGQGGAGPGRRGAGRADVGGAGAGEERRLLLRDPEGNEFALVQAAPPPARRSARRIRAQQHP